MAAEGEWRCCGHIEYKVHGVIGGRRSGANKRKDRHYDYVVFFFNIDVWGET